MAELEDRIRQDLYRAALERPQALRAISTGDTVTGDITSLLRDVVLPLTLAQGDAIIEVARVVDELAARVERMESGAPLNVSPLDPGGT